jgi:hypothetical protein
VTATEVELVSMGATAAVDRWARRSVATKRRTSAGIEAPDLNFIGENRRAKHTGSRRVDVLL